MVRTLSWLIRGLLVVVPWMVLAGMTAAYFNQIASVLRAPGVPIDHEFVVGAGKIRVRLNEYRIDQSLQNLVVTNLRVDDTVGNNQLSARNVRISGLMPRFGAKQVLDVRVSGLRGQLTRQRDGKLSLQRLLEGPEGPPVDLPYHATLDDNAVRIIDESLRPVRSWTVRSPVIRVAGREDALMVRGPLRIDGVGEAALAFHQTVRKTQWVDGVFAQLQPGNLYESYVRAALPPRVRLSPERIGGRAMARIARDGATTWAAEFDGAARGIDAEGTRLSQVAARGFVHQDAIWLAAEGREPDARGDFTGWIGLPAGSRKNPEVRGAVNARAGSLAAVERIQAGLQIPARGANVSATAWIDQRENRPQYVAQVTAGEVVASGIRLRNLTAPVYGTDQWTAAVLDQSPLPEFAARGAIVADLRRNRLDALVNAPNVNWSRAVATARRYGLSVPSELPALRGQGRVAVRVAGSTNAPEIRFAVAGAVDARVSDEFRFDARVAEIGGRFTSDGRLIARAFTAGPLGTVVALPSANDGLVIHGRGLRLNELVDDSQGVANALITVRPRGTFQGGWDATGRVEGYGLVYQDQSLPLVAANLRADPTRIRAEEITAVRGTTVVEGAVQVALQNRRLYGNLRADRLLPADLGVEDVFGLVTLPEILVGGTVDRPIVSGPVTAPLIVAQGYRAENVRTSLTWTDGKVRIGGLEAQLYGGSIRVNGTYDLTLKQGTVEGEVTNVDLEPIVVVSTPDTVLQGTATGRLTARIDEGGLTDAQLTVGAQDLVLNGTQFGRGTVEANVANGVITARGEVGLLDRYIALSDVQYNQRTRDWSGRLDTVGFPIDDLRESATPYLTTIRGRNRELLDTLLGKITVGVTLSGTPDTISFDAETLTVQSLSLDGVPFGDLAASLQKSGRDWNLRSLTLTGPTGNARIAGRVVEGGVVSLEGDLSGLNVAPLAQLGGRASPVEGRLSIPFLLTGTVDQPELRASVNTDPDARLRLVGASSEGGVAIALDDVSVRPGTRETDGIQVSGRYDIRGFSGSLEAKLRLPSLTEFNLSDPVTWRVSLDPRNLGDIAELSPVLAPDGTSGRVAGVINGRGTLNDIRFTGEANVTADSVAIRNSDFRFQNATLKLAATEAGVTTSWEAKVNDRGFTRGDLRYDLDLDTILNQGDRIADAFLEKPISGSVLLEGFRYRGSNPGGTSFDLTANTRLALTGPLRSPLISGDAVFGGVSANIAGFEPPAAGDAPLPINPRFDIRLQLAEVANVKSATASVGLLGEGTVQGSLQAPIVAAELGIESGQVRLPGGLIRFVPGGTGQFRLGGPGNQEPSFQIDARGETRLTTATTANQVERYDIDIQINGDLLKEDGLILNASSDPPGLSQARILELLGQTDILTGLGTTGGRNAAEEQLRNAFTSFTIPVVFESVTQDIAKSLGLDYLSLDYNAFDKASVLFAKSIGGGFILQGRRQVSEPPAGIRPRYEFKLVYRPRQLRGTLSRISFSIGTDESRPIKLSVEYSVRF